jgi:hypothetical protein
MNYPAWGLLGFVLATMRFAAKNLAFEKRRLTL